MKKFITIAGVCCVLPLIIIGVIFLSRGTQEPPSPLTTTTGTSISNVAPDFELTDIEHKLIKKDDLKNKPVIVWFTASYCVPCQIGAKEVRRLDEDLGGNKFDVVMVFIDLNETVEDLQWWRDNFAGQDWKIAFGNQKIIDDYKIRFLDTQYLLDKDGVIKNIANSNVGYEGYEQKLQPLIQ